MRLEKLSPYGSMDTRRLPPKKNTSIDYIIYEKTPRTKMPLTLVSLGAVYIKVVAARTRTLIRSIVPEFQLTAIPIYAWLRRRHA